MTALSLSWFRPKPKPQPTPEQVWESELSRFYTGWKHYRDWTWLLSYVKIEGDEEKRRDACFKHLFTALRPIAEGKYFTNDMRERVAYPYVQDQMRDEFSNASAIIRLTLGLTPHQFGQAMLQNISVSNSYRGDVPNIALQLAVERMFRVADHFKDMIDDADREIVVAFLLQKLAERTIYESMTAIGGDWKRMFDLAKYFAGHRKEHSLTQQELVDLRNALVVKAPHYARAVQSEIHA